MPAADVDPGRSAITATAFTTAIEDSANFKTSRSVGAWSGLTTGRYQSGEVDYDGHISRRGDAHLSGLLYEAATVILTRTKADCSLRAWGRRLREKIGLNAPRSPSPESSPFSTHAMLKADAVFDRAAGAMT